MWRNEPCGGSAVGSHFLSYMAPNKMERSRQVWAVVHTSAGLISTSDGREERTTILGVRLSFSSSSYISSAPHSVESGRGETQNENKWGVGKAFGQWLFVCMSLPSMAFRSLPLAAAVEPKDRPGTLRAGSAERPGGRIEQAGILSIQPLQAAWETKDRTIDSLCLLVYCWASVLWGAQPTRPPSSPHPFLLMVFLTLLFFCLFPSSTSLHVLFLLWPYSFSHRTFL